MGPRTGPLAPTALCYQFCCAPAETCENFEQKEEQIITTKILRTRSAQLTLNLLLGPVRCVEVRWRRVWCPSKIQVRLVRVVWFTILESWGACHIFGFMSTRTLRSDAQAQIETPLGLKKNLLICISIRWSQSIHTHRP